MYIGLVSSVLGPEGFDQLRAGERKLTDPDVVEAAQLLLDLQPFYQAGFQATDYVTAKAIFANGQGAMQVAGTADFSGYREVNPEADLGFIAWPGPEAGKYATNTGMELLYTVSRFASPEAQEAATKLVNWLATLEAQQMVSDLIALPVHKEITESSDPIRQETVQARGQDVIVWYDLPETNATVTVAQTEQGGLWTGRLTAQQFAEAMQTGDRALRGGRNPNGVAPRRWRSSQRRNERQANGRGPVDRAPSPPAPRSRRARCVNPGSAATRRSWQRAPFFWFLLPALIGYGILFVYPTIRAFYLSLFDWSGIGPLGDPVGLDELRSAPAERPVLERGAPFGAALPLHLRLPEHRLARAGADAQPPLAR